MADKWTVFSDVQNGYVEHNEILVEGKRMHVTVNKENGDKWFSFQYDWRFKSLTQAIRDEGLKIGGIFYG